MRQYQSMGDQLDGFIIYGAYGPEELKRRGKHPGADPGQNGHIWLTMEP
ncbi:MAG: hypothetical protein HY890_05575 [Deltaproteobacteria bacterium]|nr:hypothetical protein [Deltaproteobacteria bacterium]